MLYFLAFRPKMAPISKKHQKQGLEHPLSLLFTLINLIATFVNSSSHLRYSYQQFLFPKKRKKTKTWIFICPVWDDNGKLRGKSIHEPREKPKKCLKRIGSDILYFGFRSRSKSEDRLFSSLLGNCAQNKAGLEAKYSFTLSL